MGYSAPTPGASRNTTRFCFTAGIYPEGKYSMRYKRILCALVMAVVLICQPFALSADSESDIDTLTDASAAYVLEKVPMPAAPSLGYEWAVMGLARSGYSVPDGYFQAYYDQLVMDVRDFGGVLHNVKYTEYSRVTVALSSIGRDAGNVGGYDLTLPLGDYEKTVYQGNNGPIWALIALDSADYPMPGYSGSGTAATRQKYVDLILRCQLSDGGWVVNNNDFTVSDPDMTGMALQALAKYTYQPAVADAVRRGLDCVSDMIKNRGLIAYNASNTESISQLLVALCELGVDYRQQKYMDGSSNLLDAILRFRNRDGSFRHDAAAAGSNQMSSEQGLYALAAVRRFMNGENSLYRMTDVLDMGGDGMPHIYGMDGTETKASINADGRVSVSIIAGDTTITITGSGKFVRGENSYTVTSTGDVPCVILSRAGGNYVPLTVSTRDGTHVVKAAGNAWLIAAVKADINGDGELDIVDVVQGKAVSLGREGYSSQQKAVGDINGDGYLDIIDVVRAKAAQLGKSSLSW